MPDLFERFLHGDDSSASASLARAHAAGIRFVRCFGSTWGPEEFGVFETDRARWFAAYDRMLAATDRAGIRVAPSLLFNPHMLPGYVRKKTGRDEQIVDYLSSGSASNRLAVEYVTAIVSRYKDDPRVIFWEIGNEYNLEADLSGQWKRRPANQTPTSDQIRTFLIQIAELIKKIDTNHLVTTGNSDMRPYAWHIRQAMLAHARASDPNDYPMDWSKDSYDQYVEMLRFFNPSPIDIISVHQYPAGKDAAGWLAPDEDKATMLPWTIRAGASIGKPLYVGEFAETMYRDDREQPCSWTHSFLHQMLSSTLPIAAVWTWEYKCDDPGQTQYAVQEDHTPNMVKLIAETNRALETGSSSKGGAFERDLPTRSRQHVAAR